MALNTNIYGTAETWGTSNMTGGGFKWINFNETAGAMPRLMDGANQDKTPHGELIENSVCTQALGTESIYSHIIIENNGEFYHNDLDFVPWFLSESDDTERNSQNYQSTIQTGSNFNSWLPYQPSGYYWNYSDYCRPFALWYPKKILFELYIQLATSADVTATKQSYKVYEITPEIIAQYPFVTFAFLVPYIDSSNTETPNRNDINQFAQFGISPNIQFDIPDLTALQINYAMFKSIVKNDIPVWGANVVAFNEGSTSINICLCDEDDINVYSNGVTVAREYSAELIDYIISQAACFGLFVRIANDSNLDTSVIPLDNNDVILGVLDDYEVGHGQFTRGAANRNNKIWSWESNQSSNFDPYSPPLPYDDTTVFGTNSLYNTFIQYYACSPDGLKTLCNYIYNYINNIDTSTDDITKSIVKTFYTNNPLDVIVSLKRFPFNITEYFTSGAIAPVNIRLGEVVTSGYGWALSGQYTVVDFGSYNVDPEFDNTFLDYSPYTYYELIIPFCGSTRIDPALFMGKTLKLKMVVDLYTGACTCYILANSLCIDSVSGNCAIDIPITGIQSADFQNSVQNAITNVKNARINTAAYNLKGNLAMGATGYLLGDKGTAIVGNIISSIGTSLSLSSLGNLSGAIAANRKTEKQNYIAESKANYDLEHVQTPFNSVGSQSAANSYVEEMQARLIIYRPKFITGWDSETYGKTVGFACMLDGVVSDFDGFTVANIDVSGINASAEEKQMIAAAFANGVYL